MCYDYAYERITNLEAENTQLKKRVGELGFFARDYSQGYLGNILDICKKKLNVYEWELLANMNICYTDYKIKDCIELLQKLLDDGVFAPAPQACSYYNPYYYYNNYPPMGTVVAADPNITNALKPHPVESRMIVIEYNNDDAYWTQYMYDDQKHSVVYKPRAMEIEVGLVQEPMRLFAALKDKLPRLIFHESNLTIKIPSDYAENAHNIFRGMKDYVDSNVVITIDGDTTMITVISKDLVEKTEVVNRLLAVIVNIFGYNINDRSLVDFNILHPFEIKTDEDIAVEEEDAKNESD